MKLALITAYPPSKLTLNEYGYHLTKNFVNNKDIETLLLMTDHTTFPKQLDFDNAHKIKVNQCWGFNKYGNIFSIVKQVFREKPDYILFSRTPNLILELELILCMNIICIVFPTSCTDIICARTQEPIQIRVYFIRGLIFV